MPYLQFKGKKSFDIQLEVAIKPKDAKEQVVAQSNFKYMYWNMAQQLAHHASCGCPMRVGDLLGSGTISGATRDSCGSLLELSWGGKEPIDLPDDATRSFLEDGDLVSLTGAARGNGYQIGFGPCSGRVRPARGV